jgi:hypothetical protein
VVVCHNYTVCICKLSSDQIEFKPLLLCYEFIICHPHHISPQWCYETKYFSNHSSDKFSLKLSFPSNHALKKQQCMSLPHCALLMSDDHTLHRQDRNSRKPEKITVFPVISFSDQNSVFKNIWLSSAFLDGTMAMFLLFWSVKADDQLVLQDFEQNSAHIVNRILTASSSPQRKMLALVNGNKFKIDTH